MLEDELLPRDQSLVLMMGVSSNEYLLALTCLLLLAAVDLGVKRRERRERGRVDQITGRDHCSILSLDWTLEMQARTEHTRT